MPTENFDTESEVLLRISQGDPHAFRQIFTIYSRQVYSLCIQLTKDAEQGRRRQDLIRFNVFTNYQWLSHSPNGAYRSLLAIPTSALQTNGNLVQNPGY